MTLNILAENRCCGGRQLRLSHRSAACHCDMTCAVYLPKEAETGSVPVLIGLSGLTCTDENFTTKAGAKRYAAFIGDHQNATG